MLNDRQFIFLENQHVTITVLYLLTNISLFNDNPIYNQAIWKWYNRQRSSNPDRSTEWMYTVGEAGVSITSVLLVILVLIPPCVITYNINIPVYCVLPELYIIPEVKLLCPID